MARYSILIESEDLVHLKMTSQGLPPDVAEGLLYRALAHVQRELMALALRARRGPNVLIADNLPRGGLV